MPCKCQNCGKDYKVDVIVPDEVWERIKPYRTHEGNGLLCGACIFEAIEELGEYNVFHLLGEK